MSYPTSPYGEAQSPATVAPTPERWGIMNDGPAGDGKPWVAHMETAPGLTIGSANHTEPICRVSGYLRPVEVHAALIAAAPETAAERDRLKVQVRTLSDHRASVLETLDLAEAERDRLVEALKGIVKGNRRCRTPTQLFAWAQDMARAGLGEARQG